MFYQINVIEDPLHFNLVCPFYRDIRRECLPVYYCHWPTASKYNSLVSSYKSRMIK